MPAAPPGRSASEVKLPVWALSTDFCTSQGLCRDSGGLQSIPLSGRGENSNGEQIGRVFRAELGLTEEKLGVCVGQCCPAGWTPGAGQGTHSSSLGAGTSWSCSNPGEH